MQFNFEFDLRYIPDKEYLQYFPIIVITSNPYRNLLVSSKQRFYYRVVFLFYVVQSPSQQSLVEQI